MEISKAFVLRHFLTKGRNSSNLCKKTLIVVFQGKINMFLKLRKTFWHS